MDLHRSGSRGAQEEEDLKGLMEEKENEGKRIAKRIERIGRTSRRNWCGKFIALVEWAEIG